MGYRINIKDNETEKEFYGTKLYGYVDEKILDSYKYLIRIKKFDGEEIFDYNNENEIILSNEEFINFIIFYMRDLIEYRHTNLLAYPDWNIIYEMIHNDSSKTISWL